MFGKAKLHHYHCKVNKGVIYYIWDDLEFEYKSVKMTLYV